MVLDFCSLESVRVLWGSARPTRAPFTPSSGKTPRKVSRKYSRNAPLGKAGTERILPGLIGTVRVAPTLAIDLKPGHLIGLTPVEAPLFAGLQDVGNGADVAALDQSANRRYRRPCSTFSAGEDSATGLDVEALLETSRSWGVHGGPARVAELEKELSNIWLSGEIECSRGALDQTAPDWEPHSGG